MTVNEAARVNGNMDPLHWSAEQQRDDKEKTSNIEKEKTESADNPQCTEDVEDNERRQGDDAGRRK